MNKKYLIYITRNGELKYCLFRDRRQAFYELSSLISEDFLPVHLFGFKSDSSLIIGEFSVKRFIGDAESDIYDLQNYDVINPVVDYYLNVAVDYTAIIPSQFIPANTEIFIGASESDPQYSVSGDFGGGGGSTPTDLTNVENSLNNLVTNLGQVVYKLEQLRNSSGEISGKISDSNLYLSDIKAGVLQSNSLLDSNGLKLQNIYANTYSSTGYLYNIDQKTPTLE